MRNEASGDAQCDLDEPNEALHRNINSTRGYRPPVGYRFHIVSLGASKGRQQ